jgi:hypothetical protein
VRSNGSQENGSLPAERQGSEPAEGIVLSESIAHEVGNLFAASEDAARAIRAKAQSDADLLVRSATQEAARQARQSVAAIAEEAVPQLEARVAELRELVAGVHADLDRLTDDLNRLVGGSAAPSLPPASTPAPPVRTAEERRALLIALNMASNGASREEASRYLAEHLKDVPDRERLLDAVYGYVGPES